jgi:serine-type D-Ala-D-Ala carboxypeptidase (penicillin-binding protein 5/6)
MRKAISIALMICMLLSSAVVSHAETNAELSIVGQSAVLIDASTGQILYDKNCHEQHYPASTTKIMTAILALENLDIDSLVPIDKETAFTEGSRIYLLEGEKVTVREILYGLFLESANDAAVALAKDVSGSVDDFAVLMNKKAKECGALNTNFVNPNGLQDPAHLTTPYDLAMIARYAMQNKTFRKYVTTYHYTMAATNMQDTRYFYNTNRLLYDKKHKVSVNGVMTVCKYPGVTGIKTGYTPEAGGCLVASAKRGDTELIAVTMASTDMDRFGDCIALLDYGFANYKTVGAVSAGTDLGSVDVGRGAASHVDVTVEKNVCATLPIDASSKVVHSKVVLFDSLKAPVKKGQKAGVVKIYAGDEQVGEYPVVTVNAVGKGGPLSLIGISDAAAKMMLIILFCAAGVLLLSAFGYIMYKRHQIKVRRRKRQAERETERTRRSYDKARWEEEYYNRSNRQ